MSGRGGRDERSASRWFEWGNPDDSDIDFAVIDYLAEAADAILGPLCPYPVRFLARRNCISTPVVCMRNVKSWTLHP
jgi:hypothetical protein